jgi:hypothetical protein
MQGGDCSSLPDTFQNDSTWGNHITHPSGVRERSTPSSSHPSADSARWNNPLDFSERSNQKLGHESRLGVKVITNFIALLYRRTIRHRIGKRYTQLDHICPTLLHGHQNWDGVIQGGKACGHKCDQSGDSLEACQLRRLHFGVRVPAFVC